MVIVSAIKTVCIHSCEWQQ